MWLRALYIKATRQASLGIKNHLFHWGHSVHTCICLVAFLWHWSIVSFHSCLLEAPYQTGFWLLTFNCPMQKLFCTGYTFAQKLRDVMWLPNGSEAIYQSCQCQLMLIKHCVIFQAQLHAHLLLFRKPNSVRWDLNKSTCSKVTEMTIRDWLLVAHSAGCCQREERSNSIF